MEAHPGSWRRLLHNKSLTSCNVDYMADLAPDSDPEGPASASMRLLDSDPEGPASASMRLLDSDPEEPASPTMRTPDSDPEEPA
ncbi:hypothetical protein EYF80_047889 [Liparis tanakae]|uniref:Uncharacterized protein n=1 Tax=Liparis tanakae TaxID=230148 RepID=A0A4Z2FNM6_9TELE|nr:hypothetical protein EYF80_047889 [Liparis tanakae]